MLYIYVLLVLGDLQIDELVTGGGIGLLGIEFITQFGIPTSQPASPNQYGMGSILHFETRRGNISLASLAVYRIQNVP